MSAGSAGGEAEDGEAGRGAEAAGAQAGGQAGAAEAAGAQAEVQAGGAEPSRGRVLWEGGLQFTSAAVANLFGLVAGLVMARTLEQRDFGILQGFRLVAVFAGMATLGVPNGLAVRVPEAMAAGDEQRQRELGATAFWVVVLTHTVGAAALAWLGFRTAGDAGWIFWAYQVMAVTLVARAVVTILDALLWVEGDVARRAETGVTRSMADALVKIFGVATIGPLVVWVAEWAGILVSLPRMGLRRVAAPRNMSRRAFSALVVVGFPMYLISQLASLYQACDRAVILALLGAEALAVYGVANTLLGAALAVVAGFAQPWMIRAARMTAQGQRDELRVLTDEFATAAGWLSVPLAVGLMLGALVAVEVVIPKYHDSLAVLAGLLPVLCVRGVTSALGLVFASHGWNSKMLPMVALQLLLTLALNLLAVARGWGVFGVAAMTSVGWVITALCGNYLGWRLLGDSPGQAVRRLARLYLPVLLFPPVAWVAWVLAPRCGTPGEGPARVAVACALVLVAFLPGVVLAVRAASIPARLEALLRARGWGQAA